MHGKLILQPLPLSFRFPIILLGININKMDKVSGFLISAEYQFSYDRGRLYNIMYMAMIAPLWVDVLYERIALSQTSPQLPIGPLEAMTDPVPSDPPMSQ